MRRSLVMLVLCGSFLNMARAQERDDGTPIDGAWRMVAYKAAGTDEYVPYPAGSS